MNSHVTAGEAGQQGQDRQPVKEPDAHVRSPAPEKRDVADTSQVRGRSDEARANMKGGQTRKDQLDPGPAREEAEKSKGNAHHEGHESEPEMHRKVEKL
jgi:hypothetical protein